MRVLICGASIAGLTAAHFLHQQGAEVQIVERALVDRTAAGRPIGSMTTMYGEGMAVARRMGVLHALQQRAHRQDAQVLHDHCGRILRTVDLHRAHELQRGVLTLRRSDWHRVLHEAVTPRVPVRHGTAPPSPRLTRTPTASTSS